MFGIDLLKEMKRRALINSTPKYSARPVEEQTTDLEIANPYPAAVAKVLSGEQELRKPVDKNKVISDAADIIRDYVAGMSNTSGTKKAINKIVDTLETIV